MPNVKISSMSMFPPFSQRARPPFGRHQPTTIGGQARRLNGRNSRRHRGSVLILVVALLVLLALMGTAFISTARTERGTAVVNVANTQMALVLNGLKSAADSTIAGSDFSFEPGGAGFMPAASLYTPTSVTFSDWDSGQTQTWLADRTPEQQDVSLAWAAGNPVGWKSISLPIVGGPNGQQFASPFTPNPTTPPAIAFLPTFSVYSAWSPTVTYVIGQAVSYTGVPTVPTGFTATVTRNYVCLAANTNVQPTTSSADWTPTDSPKEDFRFEPTTVTYNGQTLPAMNLLERNVGVTGAYITLGTVAAADTDGDGIADSGLFKLPISPRDGITYYGAVRVIDNNSAINVNTATSVTTDYDASGVALAPGAATSYNPSIFSTNIGLQEMLSPVAGTYGINDLAEMNSVNSYRFDTAYQAPPSVVHDANFGPPLADDNGTTRGDFTFFSQADDLYSQLSRRQDNPGDRIVSVTGTRYPFQAFPLTDSLILASPFCINSSTGSSPLIGTYLYNSLNGSTSGAKPIDDSVANTSAYATGDIANWFNTNFNFGTAPYAGTIGAAGAVVPYYRPLRSQLTTTDAVSTAEPTQSASTTTAQITASLDMLPYTAPTWSSATPYIASAWVLYTSVNYAGKPANQPKMYRCLTGGTSHQPDDSPGYWLCEPWSATPQKSNINTSTFGDMWRSYYAVMADTAGTAPLTAFGGHVGQRMFKSSIRPISLATPMPADAMTDYEEMELRSALAAVNAETLRSGNDDVISHTVALYDPTATPPSIKRHVTVYGQQTQPFITEVFVHVDPTSHKPDYVAVELYNPYEPATSTNTHLGPTFDMGISGVGNPAGSRMIHLGCRIGIIDRKALYTATTPPALPNAPSTSNTEDITPTSWPSTAIVAPGQYLVLESDMTKRPSNVVVPPSITPVELPKLMDAFAGAGPLPDNSEIVLTRTRLATGTPSSVSTAQDRDPMNQYNEITGTPGVPLFLSFAPFEQFDFTGWGSSPNGLAGGRYDYTRPTPPSTPLGTADKLYWRCVFPNAGTAGSFETTYSPAAGGLMASVPVIPDANTTDLRRNGSLGLPDPGFFSASGTPTAEAISWPVIQLNNIDWPGPPASTTPATNQYPFGGFTRLGDILEVPFIGAYQITSGGTPATLEEEMSVSMDSRYAEDSNPDTASATAGNLPPLATPANDGSMADNVDEQIGRFCPLADCRPLNTGGYPNMVYKTPTATPATTDDYYWWASRLFDYFSVLSPTDEMFPQANPLSYPAILAGLPSAVNKEGPSLPPYITYGRVASGGASGIQNTTNLSNTDNFYSGALIEFLSGSAKGECVRISGYTGASQTITFQTSLTAVPAAGDLFRIIANPTGTVASQGLININTASWKVLSMLPLVRNVDGSVDNAAPTYHNDEMAQSIVAYRDIYGPFRSIFDLNQVPLITGGLPSAIGFQSGGPDAATGIAHIDLSPAPTVPVDIRQGDFSPIDTTKQFPLYSTTPPSDGVVDDFEERFLAMTRISNMITTRSDSFTVYLLVQAWRNAGLANAQMVGQKRMAFIADRSQVGPGNFDVQTAIAPTP